MDKVVEAIDNVKKDWEETYGKTLEHVKAIQEYGKSGRGTEEKNSLPRLNGLAQDGLAMLTSLQFKLDLLVPQLLTDEDVQSAQATLESWRNQFQSLHVGLRNAKLQAKANMRKLLRKRGNFFLGVEKNLQFVDAIYISFIIIFRTKAGMTSAAESITESLRRTRQLMVQEVERSASTLMTFEESTGVLRKADTEYKGHRSLLMRTRNLLSTMQRQDILERVILIVGFCLFSCAVIYVVSKRVGLLKLQRKVIAAMKAGTIKQAQIVGDGMNRVQPNAVPMVEVPLEQPMHDEL